LKRKPRGDAEKDLLQKDALTDGGEGKKVEVREAKRRKGKDKNCEEGRQGLSVRGIHLFSCTPGEENIEGSGDLDWQRSSERKPSHTHTGKEWGERKKIEWKRGGEGSGAQQ